MDSNLFPRAAKVGEPLLEVSVWLTGQAYKCPASLAYTLRRTALQASATAPQVTAFVQSILHELHMEGNPKNRGPVLNPLTWQHIGWVGYPPSTTETHGLMHPRMPSVRGCNTDAHWAQPEQTHFRESHMGSTFTVVVIVVAAMLACVAFGLAQSLRALLPPPPAVPHSIRPGGTRLRDLGSHTTLPTD